MSEYSPTQTLRHEDGPTTKENFLNRLREVIKSKIAKYNLKNFKSMTIVLNIDFQDLDSTGKKGNYINNQIEVADINNWEQDIENSNILNTVENSATLRGTNDITLWLNPKKDGDSTSIDLRSNF